MTEQAMRDARVHETVGSACIWLNQLGKFLFSSFVNRTNGDDSSLSAAVAIEKMIGRDARVSARKSMV
ncbi:hypothetical protein [Xanthomonas melonis]|uniref:hypothetical protein n=1 Tax=Xanthomonas melonis TaxID=56456 RepID=UPI003EBA82C9